jgi:hypothetical protein
VHNRNNDVLFFCVYERVFVLLYRYECHFRALSACSALDAHEAGILFMYMYVYIYVCMYICICICICICIYTYIYIIYIGAHVHNRNDAIVYEDKEAENSHFIPPAYRAYSHGVLWWRAQVFLIFFLV